MNENTVVWISTLQSFSQQLIDGFLDRQYFFMYGCLQRVQNLQDVFSSFLVLIWAGIFCINISSTEILGLFSETI